MNALTKTHSAFADAVEGFIPESPITLKRRLDQAIRIYDNPWTSVRKMALENLLAGKPGYWTSSTHTNAAGCGAVDAANTGEAELTAHVGRWVERIGVNDAVRCTLDTLVPLNRAATAMLLRVYEAHGHFRDEAELRQRAVVDRRGAA